MKNPPPRDPIEMLSHAIDVMAGEVRPNADHNVVLGSQYWYRERPDHPVSIVGAYLLSVQPAPDDDDHAAAPDPIGVASHSLGVAYLWLEGLADGFAMAPDENRLRQFPASDPRGQQYRDGLYHGQKLRAQEAA